MVSYYPFPSNKGIFYGSGSVGCYTHLSIIAPGTRLAETCNTRPPHTQTHTPHSVRPDIYAHREQGGAGNPTGQTCYCSLLTDTPVEKCPPPCSHRQAASKLMEFTLKTKPTSNKKKVRTLG